MIQYNFIKDSSLVKSKTNMDEINTVEGEFKVKFPLIYVDFILNYNGVLFDNGVSIYSIDDIYQRNLDFEVQEYIEVFIAIGDDSGGRCIMLCLSNSSVYYLDQGSMDVDDIELISLDFKKAIEILAQNY